MTIWAILQDVILLFCTPIYKKNSLVFGHLCVSLMNYECSDFVVLLTRITLYLQAEKVKFQLRLGQSKPIYNAFKAIQESPDWQTLSDSHKRIVESKLQIIFLLLLFLWCYFISPSLACYFFILSKLIDAATKLLDLFSNCERCWMCSWFTIFWFIVTLLLIFWFIVREMLCVFYLLVFDWWYGISVWLYS